MSPAVLLRSTRQTEPFDRTAAVLAASVLVVHLAGNAHYGFFRDELYYLVCGRRPAFGYVDQPPLAPLLAAASQLFGTSLIALRAVPALLAAIAAYVTARLASDMGGSGFAKSLAVAGMALAPVLAAFGTLLGPDAIQLPLWPWLLLLVGRALDRDPRYWLSAGLVLGVAGEAKYSAVMLAAAIVVGLVLGGRHRAFATRWLYAGMALAALLLLPNFLWQWYNGFPMVELLRNGQHGKNVMLGPVEFLLQQVMLTNPVLALVWLVGLVACLIDARWRWLGVTALALLALMIVLHGKAYYPAPLYPALFAAGAAAIERMTHRRAWLRTAMLVPALAAGALLLPLSMPLLPEEAFVKYQAALSRDGLGAREMEHHQAAALGQIYADMHGWPELAAAVGSAYAHLPPELRARTWIYTGNYGEAAAIDVLGTGYGMPPALSGHNQYWLWGPRGWDGTALLDVGGDLEADRRLCGSAEQVATFSAPYVMPYEDDLPIILCRDLKQPVSAAWPRWKHYE